VRGLSHIINGVRCWCFISTGAVLFSASLQENQTLQILHMNHNSEVGDEGISAIAATLANSNLRVLHLRGCGFSLSGATLLAEGLMINQSITDVDLSFNTITVDGASAILEAAVRNGICQKVKVNDEYESDGRIKEMLAILTNRRNSNCSVM